MAKEKMVPLPGRSTKRQAALRFSVRERINVLIRVRQFVDPLPRNAGRPGICFVDVLLGYQEDQNGNGPRVDRGRDSPESRRSASTLPTTLIMLMALLQVLINLRHSMKAKRSLEAGVDLVHGLPGERPDGMEDVLLTDRDKVRAIHDGRFVQARCRVIGMRRVEQELRRLTPR